MSSVAGAILGMPLMCTADWWRTENPFPPAKPALLCNGLPIVFITKAKIANRCAALRWASGGDNALVCHVMLCPDILWVEKLLDNQTRAASFVAVQYLCKAHLPSIYSCSWGCTSFPSEAVAASPEFLFYNCYAWVLMERCFQHWSQLGIHRDLCILQSSAQWVC